MEGDESASPERRDYNPLADMSINRLSDSTRNGLHIPKVRDGAVHGSPARRGPSTPSKSGAGSGTAKAVGARRRSNIGPMRNEKGRRRSSMIPQLSPPTADGSSGPRRIMLASPAKRTKRMSLTKSASAAALKLRSTPLGANSSMANLSVMDPNTSADLSFSKQRKATWR
ncbi:hypothetical protein LshimejAT787_0104230 [Lyophyllum shimeji]|uniref:Uncharacterized protein n=1 Tax=Lyophyllum shimeji TaxID=47721 RepID=A0A9P3PDL4_LYOSH|nr:hypothetical protein LshimejAT787_0104230 [Lyophyllum shimeji]